MEASRQTSASSQIQSPAIITQAFPEFQRDPKRFLREDPLLRQVFREALRGVQTLGEVREGVLFPVCDILREKVGVEVLAFVIAQITTRNIKNPKEIHYRLRNDLRHLAWTKAAIRFIQEKQGKKAFVFSSATLLGILLPEDLTSRDLTKILKVHGLNGEEIQAVFDYQPETRIINKLKEQGLDDPAIQMRFKEHCDDILLNTPVTDIIPVGKVHRSNGCRFELQKAEEIGETREIRVHKDAQDYPLFIQIAEQIRCFKREPHIPVGFIDQLTAILRTAAMSYESF